MSTIKNALLRILAEYISASKESFVKHPLADFLRNGAPDIIRNIIPDDGQYLVTGSAGQGVWARAPWLAIFNIQITDSAQRGYYPVYLFREDMSGVYLSLNQGATEAREGYKSNAKDALRSRAKNFYSRLGNQTADFTSNSIDLRASSLTNDSTFYEAGSILSKFYDINNFPEEDTIKADLISVLNFYNQLVYSEETLSEKQALEDDEQDESMYEDLRELRIHKRVERNAELSKRVKKIQGYTCKICGFNYEKTYGELGKGYIEAHHLTPVSKIKGQKLKRDPKTDFAVLCANCHRMVHRSNLVHDIETFKKKHLNS